MPETYQNKKVVIVEEALVGLRLDRYLADIWSEISRTGIQDMIRQGQISVNGKVGKSGYRLREGDCIEMPVAPIFGVKEETPQPLDIDLDIVYEDVSFMVVNKPAGLVVHPGAGHHDDTLVNALIARVPSLQEVGEVDRAGIVHRLDKDTSGLLLVAKTAQAHAALTEQMQQHLIEKRYLALVHGIVGPDQGQIDAPIGRDERYRQRMTITAIGGREAVTRFQVLKRYQRHTFLLLQLETGRTHQIRVHLHAIGHPVVGDPTYGKAQGRAEAGLQRQFLHAYSLRLKHPLTGEEVLVEAQLPDDLRSVLENEMEENV